MTTRSRTGIRFGAVKFRLLIAIAAVASAAPIPAIATSMTYTLSPPVIGGGDSIIGVFTIDTAGPTLDAADLLVTGGLGAGTYNSNPSLLSPETIEVYQPSGGDFLEISFADPLTSDQTDPATSAMIGMPPLAAGFPPLDVSFQVMSGAADPPATPEPSSIALLGGALALLLLTRLANLQGRRA
jgi:hypothetical protein